MAQIADPNPAAAEDAAKMFRIPSWTTDPNRVIEDEQVEAVIICSPTKEHSKQILASALQGKNIFCTIVHRGGC